MRFSSDTNQLCPIYYVKMEHLNRNRDIECHNHKFTCKKIHHYNRHISRITVETKVLKYLIKRTWQKLLIIQRVFTIDAYLADLDVISKVVEIYR